MKESTLVLFDFDGTLTRTDSFIAFIIFSKGYFRAALGLLICSPWIILYLCKLLPNDATKRRVFTHFFKGELIEKFKQSCHNFATERIDHMLKKEAFAKLMWHKQNHHTIYLVTASIENYIKSWSDKHSIGLIGTRVEINNNRLTGNFATPNCYGPQKAERIKNSIDLRQYKTIYAYGDTRGDREMLKIADKKYFRCYN